MKGDPYEENIPNTFAPNSRNKMFSIAMIIHGLRFGFLHMDSLPTDIRKKVNDVLESRKIRSIKKKKTYNIRDTGIINQETGEFT